MQKSQKVPPPLLSQMKVGRTVAKHAFPDEMRLYYPLKSAKGVNIHL